MPLDRDGFLRSLLSHLSKTLEDVVGLREAAGFISVVGQTIGERINSDYRTALQVPELNREQVTAVLIDLKRRIQGDFYVLEEDADRIVLGNRACPFGEAVEGRPSLCMMTSNVFGHIVAENGGYAKVAVEESIAQGHAGCRIVVWLNRSSEAEAAEGREYFRST